jgi:hypothetical protein
MCSKLFHRIEILCVFVYISRSDKQIWVKPNMRIRWDQEEILEM